MKPVDNNVSKSDERIRIDNGIRSNGEIANYGSANNAAANYGSANRNNNNDNDNASRLPGHTKEPPASVSSHFYLPIFSGFTSELILSHIHSFRGHQ